MDAYRQDAYEQPILRSTASGTVTNEVKYLGPFSSGPYNMVRVEFDLESESGTHTLDEEFEYFSQANGDWTSWLDSAGTQIKVNNYADGETGRRYVLIGLGATGGADADGVLVVGTSNTHYDTPLMPVWRIKQTIGGTAVSNVLSCSVYWMNR